MVVNVYAYILAKRRYSKEFYKRLNDYLQIDYIEEPFFNEKQFRDQLKDNEFYKNSKDMTIEQFPIVNKQFIKNNYKKIINKKEISTYLHTSGTTGSGFTFPVSRQFMNNQWAVFWKFRTIHGLPIGTWMANIIGQTMFDARQNKPPYWIKSYPTKQLLLSSYHLKKENVIEYINVIKHNKIIWIHGYPSIINEFANLIKENNLLKEARQLNLRMITTSSEKLFTYQKENVKNTFECEVREMYGLVEGVVNIFECENGSLHIDENYSYVELIPKDKNENEYKIIGTSYYNKAFPLVRYDTNDTCSLPDKDFKCTCGRKSRVVKEIFGRDDDYLILSNGTRIGRLSPLFKSSIAIKEAQIYQNKIGSAQFRVVKDKNYTDKDEMILRDQITEKLGEDFNYEIAYVSSIAKTKSGKHKLVINEIDENI
jgi:phenylacetate-CoA ligase